MLVARRPRSSPMGATRLQVREQVDGNNWQYVGVPQTSISDWLKEHAPQGARIGYDAWVHTKGWVESATKALAGQGRRTGRGEEQPHRRGLGRPARQERRDADGPQRPICRTEQRRKTRRRCRMADREQARQHGDFGARFGRVAAQRARQGCVEHAGRLELRSRPCRRHRRPVRRARKGRRRCRARIWAMPSACARRRSSCPN